MGGGSWSAATYSASTDSKMRSHGTAFVHSKTAHTTGRYDVHETLNPKAVAGSASPFAGKIMREARDSGDHPESLPIAVFFDVTGSMGGIPTVLQQKLPKLHGLLLAKGYVEHPQLMFGAIGDATCDRVPLQVGQFESDNRGDENLENLILEGGGGGGNHESYQLAAYFLARHTVHDAMEKRGKKGYAFFIGDERVYRKVNAREVKSQIGDGLQEDLDTKTIFDEVKKNYDTYFLFAEEGTYEISQVLDPNATDSEAYSWREVLGQHALLLEDATAVCETIALTIGLAEGSIDLDEGLEHLREAGTEDKAIEATGKALAAVGAGAPALGEASGEIESGDEDGAERL